MKTVCRVFLVAALMGLGGLLTAQCGPSAGQTGGNNNNNQPVQCNPGETDCGGVCAELSTDPNHCGQCGNACTGNQFCDGSGRCAGDCAPGLSLCGSACFDLMFDAANCGSCGFQCGPLEICENGGCTEDQCAETSSEAETGLLPADVILVVDNSGSMTDEAGFVQAAMTDFANIIIGAGIDVHVILISADSTDEQGVCVPPPLGSGSCPNDENLPVFRHVVAGVGSSNGLQMVLDTYPQWSAQLRLNATKTIAIITDDNSALSALDFTNALLALDPTFTGFKFDAIYAPYDLSPLTCNPLFCAGNCQNCDPCCGANSGIGLCTPLPADEGTVYRQLVQDTNGVEGDLCQQDFVPVFQDMATAVVSDSQVSCVYNIPDPPGGGTIDHNRVNVEWRESPGAPDQQLFNIPGGANDCGPGGGWYYDDPVNPTQILLCPATCTLVQSFPNASLDVKFGCATVVR